MLPVAYPYVYGTRVLTPCLLKTFKFRFCRFQTGRTVDLFQLGCKTFIVFIWNIFYGIADKMDNTSLNRYIGENCFCSLLKSAYTIHRKKQHIFHAPILNLIKNLHPLMLTFWFTKPKTKNIFLSIHIIAQNYINGIILCLIVFTNRYVQTIHK